MRVRVTEVERSTSSTHARTLEPAKAPHTVAEGTLVFYRLPSLDGRPRWDYSEQDLVSIVEGCHRIAVLVGEGAEQKLWATSHTVYCVVDGSGFKVRTQNATYHVDILDEGGSVQRSRRQTGVIPVYRGSDDR